MNRKDILRMAREAGMEFQGGFTRFAECVSEYQLHNFAALVAAAERAACEKTCDDLLQEAYQANQRKFSEHGQGVEDGMFECVEAIRARGQA